MYWDDPFQDLPPKLDAFGRRGVDEFRLTPSQRMQWQPAQQRGLICPSRRNGNMPPAAEASSDRCLLRSKMQVEKNRHSLFTQDESIKPRNGPYDAIGPKPVGADLRVRPGHARPNCGPLIGQARWDGQTHGNGQTRRSAPRVLEETIPRQNRRSIRLQRYDYSRAGAYFVTICAQNRECLFGGIVDGAMQVNDAGRMIQRWLSELENKFPGIKCDDHVCMPNHIHCIIVIVGEDLRVRPAFTDLRDRPNGTSIPAGSSLSSVVQWFKTMTTNEYIWGVKHLGWAPFPGKLWQRNYWEHVVRNENDLNQIREYIRNNPAQWELDKLYVPSDGIS